MDSSFTVLSAVMSKSGTSTPVNVNDLVVDNPSGLYLQLAEGINSRGEISGFSSSSTDLADIPHAFLAIPDKANATGHGSTPGPNLNRAAPMNENTRKLIQQRMRFGRFGVRPSIRR